MAALRPEVRSFRRAGLFGAGRAAEGWYGVRVQELQPWMSARMAAVLPSPKRMRVHPPSPYTLERSHWILRQMRQLSGIDHLRREEEQPPEVEEPEEVDIPELSDQESDPEEEEERARD